MKKRKNIGALKTNAQTLRKTATPQENKLWYQFLRTYPVKFRRQVTFECYIVDFYCPTEKLVVELDGSQHYSEAAQQYDAYRTKVIEHFGCKVVRYPNSDVDLHFYEVCEAIDYEVRRRCFNGQKK